MVAAGHSARITTRSEAGRGAIEQAGAECWIGTPDRLATLRGALDSVTIACWLLGSASGGADELEALHGTRLEYFLTQTVDSTVRGVIYESAGSVPSEVLAQGAALALALAERNAIPIALLAADPVAVDGWLEQVREAIDSLLRGV